MLLFECYIQWSLQRRPKLVENSSAFEFLSLRLVPKLSDDHVVLFGHTTERVSGNVFCAESWTDKVPPYLWKRVPVRFEYTLNLWILIRWLLLQHKFIHNIWFTNRKEMNLSDANVVCFAHRQYPKIRTWKKLNSVFSVKDMHYWQVIFVVTYRVTNFLPKLVDMLLFSVKKNWISIFWNPLFSGIARAHTLLKSIGKNDVSKSCTGSLELSQTIYVQM